MLVKLDEAGSNRGHLLAHNPWRAVPTRENGSTVSVLGQFTVADQPMVLPVDADQVRHDVASHGQTPHAR
jgi:hypothetical protein